ncbi:hypothetical protein GCM10009122_31330 [Fulvivirga kasyanovii]
MYDEGHIAEKKCERDNAVVEAENSEWLGLYAYKGKPVTVVDISGDMKSNAKACYYNAHNEEAEEVHLVHVNGVEE